MLPLSNTALWYLGYDQEYEFSIGVKRMVEEDEDS